MHLWQYNNEIIISQFCDTSGDTNKQLIDGQKIIDIRPHTRYNVSNLIRKQCYHYCYRWNGSHIYEKIIGTEWLNPQGDNVSDLTAKTIFLR